MTRLLTSRDSTGPTSSKPSSAPTMWLRNASPWAPSSTWYDRLVVAATCLFLADAASRLHHYGCLWLLGALVGRGIS